MNEQMTFPAIEVRDLSKRFGSVTALDGVSFEVQAGEMFFLLGPSGCGKTTLLRILAGLESPDAGSVRFDGREVLGLAPHKRGAPMVFQQYALWPHMTVAENVAFGLVEKRVPRSEAASRVREALETVGLQGMEGRRPAQLSGGQQQRVALARALVLQPRVVLLDEPLSNLDAQLRQEMREEIERLHRRTSITFVYVTHDQVEALSLADRVAVLVNGRVSAVGTPASLYHRPPNLFCAGFLGEANLAAGTVRDCAGGRAEIQTAWGVWRAAAGGRGLKPGMAVRCVVRPEHFRVGVGPAGSNTLEGVVQFSRMNGATVTVGFRAGEEDFKATMLNSGSLEQFKEGQAVMWHVDPDRTVALPEEAAV